MYTVSKTTLNVACLNLLDERNARIERVAARCRLVNGLRQSVVLRRKRLGESIKWQSLPMGQRFVSPGKILLWSKITYRLQDYAPAKEF